MIVSKLETGCASKGYIIDIDVTLNFYSPTPAVVTFLVYGWNILEGDKSKQSINQSWKPGFQYFNTLITKLNIMPLHNMKRLFSVDKNSTNISPHDKIKNIIYIWIQFQSVTYLIKTKIFYWKVIRNNSTKFIFILKIFFFYKRLWKVKPLNIKGKKLIN